MPACIEKWNIASGDSIVGATQNTGKLAFDVLQDPDLKSWILDTPVILDHPCVAEAEISSSDQPTAFSIYSFVQFLNP